MTNFQPDFSKLFGSMPTFDTKALTTAQQRNMDAFVQASQVLANGTQTAITRQIALMQSLFQEGAAVFQASLGSKDPQAGMRTQIEFVTAAQQKAFALATEIAEIAQTTSKEAFELLRKRAEEGTAEVVAFQKKAA